MKSYENGILQVINLEEAKNKQFLIVDVISRHFSGEEIFQMGDLGIYPIGSRPRYTAKVERVLAEVFGTEDVALVRGAGTGAIRILISVLLKSGGSVFLHKAPVFSTTRETLDIFNIKKIFADYNNLGDLTKTIQNNPDCKVLYIQHARQQPEDIYDLKELISQIRYIRQDMSIVVDDKYCVFKTPKIGVEMGADYSTFSGFKLMGPEGIGIIVGKKDGILKARQQNFSGGGQIQGWESMELLRSLVMTPVSFAVQNEQVDAICRRLKAGEVPGVVDAFISNAQSRNIIVKWEKPVAKQIVEVSKKYGAAVYPVGSESRYEILPLIYKVSKSFIQANPEMAQTTIRINPMRSGVDTVIRILNDVAKDVLGN